ncbi:MAG: hypothetical protein V7K68_17550 [Nostoc sp.]|uniref:hypothetical protein n=1 Tax=Nostoc sp. TaxID=1180 RepID=UPI002FFAAE8F
MAKIKNKIDLTCNQVEMEELSDVEMKYVRGGAFSAPVPKFQVPQFQVPQFQVPQFQVPEFQMPEFQMPEFQMPEFQIPEFH